MKRNVSKVMIKVTNLAYNTSRAAGESASWWGFYQAKEPENIKFLKKKKL